MAGNTENAQQVAYGAAAQASAEVKPYRMGDGVMPIVIYATSPEEARGILADRLAGKS
jgi:hypothetical protein|nr:hypothetical protein [Neorhizobium tomejilense]